MSGETRWGTHTQCIITQHTKGDIMPCPATKTEVEMIILSEVRQERNIIGYHSEVDFLNGCKWTSLPNRKTSQHSKAPYSYQKGKVVGRNEQVDWAGGDEHTITTLYVIHKYTLLFMKYSSRTPIQHCIINYMGRKSKKGHVHVYA